MVKAPSQLAQGTTKRQAENAEYISSLLSQPSPKGKFIDERERETERERERDIAVREKH